MTQPLRIGYQLAGDHEADPIASALTAEELGFDVMLVSDHIGSGRSPLPTLGAIAQSTSRIRLGTFVLNNDMRNPVQLAWEATTLDRLSAGRFELGLGAGHTPQEYAATGMEMEYPKQRKDRLAESVEIIRQLLKGEPVDFDGDHYRIRGAQVDRSQQEHLPILVGGNGETLLGHAGAHADIIGLQGLGRTQPDGHSHAVRWDPDWLTTQIEQVRRGAGRRFDQIELNVMVQMVEITDDRDAALRAICERVSGLSFEHAASIPYILVGTINQITHHILECQNRWGISYFVVRELEAFAPVLAELR